MQRPLNSAGQAANFPARSPASSTAKTAGKDGLAAEKIFYFGSRQPAPLLFGQAFAPPAALTGEGNGLLGVKGTAEAAAATTTFLGEAIIEESHVAFITLANFLRHSASSMFGERHRLINVYRSYARSPSKRASRSRPRCT